MGTLSRIRDFTADRDATPPVAISAQGMDDEFDQLVTESNAQDVRLDTLEATGNVSTADLADDAVTPAKTSFVDDTLAATDTHIMVADGTDFDNVAVSGDATLSNTGVLTIGNDKLVTAKVLDLNITTGKLASDAVTPAKASFTDDSLAATDTHIMVADGTDFGNVAVSGDATLANTGALTIGNDKITTAKILDGNVTLAKLADPTATNKLLGRTTAGSGDWEEVTIQTTLTSTDDAIPSSKAVRDDIVSLVNDVGGFVAVADDQSFPNTNPDPDDGAGTVVSISNAGGLVVNGSGVTTTGRSLDSSTVTINGIPSTYQSTTITDGLGMQVISTSTLHTYSYHKITAKEADTNTVATNITNVNNCGNNIADIGTVAGQISPTNNVSTVAGISSDVTSVAGISSNVTTVAGISSDVTSVASNNTNVTTTATNISNVNNVGGSISNVNTVAGQITPTNNVSTVAGISANVTSVAGIAANVTTVAGISANVTSVANNEANVNRYADEYTIAASAPSSGLNEGDLWFDETNNVLKVYNGSAWTAVTSATAGIMNVVDDTTPELGGDLSLNGNSIDFPTTPNINDCLDEDNMASNSATKLCTQQSIKSYVDNNAVSAGFSIAMSIAL